MRILILEDEPIIAIDLEDIVSSSRRGAECLVSSSIASARRHVAAGIDFALLDINIGHSGNSSYALAADLMARQTPFCFVSSADRNVPQPFRSVPFVAKPFRPSDIVDALAKAA